MSIAHDFGGFEFALLVGMNPVPRVGHLALAFTAAATMGCSSNGGGSPGVGGNGGAVGSAGAGGSAGSGDGGTTGGGGAANAGGFVANGGCHAGDDCPSGSTCARFGDNGPGACTTPTAPISSCSGNNPRNQCCATSDCSAGSCFSISKQPVQCSSTAGFDTYNVCLADSCTGDTDCAAQQLCTPVGFGLARTCVVAACRSDADCTAEAGGACVLLELGCCTPRIGGNAFRDTQLACVYPSGGCQKDADCPGGFCTITGGRASCSSDCQ